MTNSIYEEKNQPASMRETLINAYLDYVNNYLTIEKYAEHNGLTPEQARALLDVARAVYGSKHPDA